MEELVRPLLERSVDPEVRAEAWIALAHALRAMGRHDEAAVEYRAILDQPDTAPAVRPFLKACIAVEEVWLGNSERAIAMGEETVRDAEIASSAGNTRALAHGASALNAILAGQLMRGMALEAVASGRRALALLERSGTSQSGRTHPETAAGLGPALSDADESAEAMRVLSSGIKTCDDIGFLERLVTLHGYLAIEFYRSGRLDDALGHRGGHRGGL